MADCLHIRCEPYPDCQFPDEWELLEALGNVRFQFWTCPIREHSERGGLFGAGTPVVTVEWRGDVAHCTAPGCGHTSRDAGQENPDG